MMTVNLDSVLLYRYQQLWYRAARLVRAMADRGILNSGLWEIDCSRRNLRLRMRVQRRADVVSGRQPVVFSVIVLWPTDGYEPRVKLADRGRLWYLATKAKVRLAVGEALVEAELADRIPPGTGSIAKWHWADVAEDWLR